MPALDIIFDVVIAVLPQVAPRQILLGRSKGFVDYLRPFDARLKQLLHLFVRRKLPVFDLSIILPMFPEKADNVDIFQKWFRKFGQHCARCTSKFPMAEIVFSLKSRCLRDL